MCSLEALNSYLWPDDASPINERGVSWPPTEPELDDVELDDVEYDPEGCLIVASLVLSLVLICIGCALYFWFRRRVPRLPKALSWPWTGWKALFQKLLSKRQAPAPRPATVRCFCWTWHARPNVEFKMLLMLFVSGLNRRTRYQAGV